MLMETETTNLQNHSHAPGPAPKEDFIKEIVKFTLLALVIVIPIRMYIAQPFIVSGASMDPTFKDRQYLIVDELSYRFEKPKREDVVIFRYPVDEKTFFIKRIIGLPGETVDIKLGKIYVSTPGEPEPKLIDDSHIADSRKSKESFNITLGPDEYFVMGDNRNESSDSRAWGPLNRKYIVGRPFLSLWPLNRIGAFPGR
jgi:signal peptidase I